MPPSLTRGCLSLMREQKSIPKDKQPLKCNIQEGVTRISLPQHHGKFMTESDLFYESYPAVSSTQTLPTRLAQIIAQSGLCSRRAASRLISAGQVQVNGIPATHHQAIEPQDLIEVAGVPLKAAEPKQYWLYHKPVGIDCNNNPDDPHSIAQVLQTLPVRLFAAGRLDKDSHGLLLLTNDGMLVQRLMHPDYSHQKRYKVTVDKAIDAAMLHALATGVSWQVGPHQYQARPCLAKAITPYQLDITLTEGQNRQIRYMCRALGYHVTALCRVAIGALQLGDLAPGACRQLTPEELPLLLSLQPPQTAT